MKKGELDLDAGISQYLDAFFGRRAGTARPGRWSQKALFISLVLLPIVYLLSMIRAWRHRDEIRAKSGGLGLFSLWFPLQTTLAAAWVILWLMPTLLGTPIDNPALFQPDLGMPMIATAGLGVVGVHSSLTGDGHRRRDIRSAYRSCSLEPTGF